MLATLAGGIGLFLIGMSMLTEGLKLAAGRALENLLKRGTATAPRGLAAGFLITSLVQSSAAVTVASIGFVNTGLLPLNNALWALFGSNLGSTTNAWVVAALGFGFRIDAFALSFIGVGAVLMLSNRRVRTRALGQALGGFGILFLGLSVLKNSFSGLGDALDLQTMVAPGVLGMLLLIALGTALTVLMQTSSAVIAIVISAAQGGLIPVDAACTIVIGTNIGTTSPAILASLGGTSSARRLAAAHVFFNLVTASAALVLLLSLRASGAGIYDAVAGQATPATMIALFHTTSNVIGVLLMVPLAPPMLRMLQNLFRTREEVAAWPRHLDTSSLSVPDLALHALRLELLRTQEFAIAALQASSQAQSQTPGPAGRDGGQITRNTSALQALAGAISNYAHQLSAARLPTALTEELAHSLRSLRYQETAAVHLNDTVELEEAVHGTVQTNFASEHAAWRRSVARLSALADPRAESFSPGALSLRLEETESHYQALKEALFLAGAHAELDIRSMQDWLRLISLVHRASKQVVKAARMIAALEGGTSATEAEHSEAVDENAD